jgi:hypothetical protein
MRRDIGVVEVVGRGETGARLAASTAVRQGVAEDAAPCRIHVRTPRVRRLDADVAAVSQFGIDGAEAAPVPVDRCIGRGFGLDAGVEVGGDSWLSVRIAERSGVLGPEGRFGRAGVAVVGGEAACDRPRHVQRGPGVVLGLRAAHEVDLHEEILVPWVGAPQRQRQIVIGEGTGCPRRDDRDLPDAADLVAVGDAVAVGVARIGQGGTGDTRSGGCAIRAGAERVLQFAAEPVAVDVVTGQCRVVAKETDRPGRRGRVGSRSESVAEYAENDMPGAGLRDDREAGGAGDTAADDAALDAQAVRLQHIYRVGGRRTAGQPNRLEKLGAPQAQQNDLGAAEPHTRPPGRTVAQDVCSARGRVRAGTDDEPVGRRRGGAVGQARSVGHRHLTPLAVDEMEYGIRAVARGGERHRLLRGEFDDELADCRGLLFGVRCRLGPTRR